MMSVRLQVVLYLLASMTLWTVGVRIVRHRSGSAWAERIVDGWQGQILQFIYYIGFPYLAVVLGILPVNYLGLRGLGNLPGSASAATNFLDRGRAQISATLVTWLPDIGPAVRLLIIMAGALSLAWLIYVIFKRAVYRRAKLAEETPLEWQQSLQEVIYQQVHWSFYRGAIWVLAGDLYLAVIGGMLLVAAEWMLGADWVQRIQRVPQAEILLLDASLLVVTAASFYIVPNLWLLIPMHWMLSVLCRLILRRGSIRQPVELRQS